MSMLESKIKKVMPITQDHEEVLDLVFTPEEEKVAIPINVTVPVKKGTGKKDFGWKPTFGATGDGYAEITGPDSGVWDILVYDLTAKQYIIKKYGVKKGEKVYFSYKTSFFGVHPTVNVLWSEGGDTTLAVHINLSV